MNWMERLYEIKNKDLYSQGGEGIIIESILINLNNNGLSLSKICADIGAGPDSMLLSNSRHMKMWGWQVKVIDKELNYAIDADNAVSLLQDFVDPFQNGMFVRKCYDFISIDIDGNDYWVLDALIPAYRPALVVAEFNAMYTDSRTIAYNPDHVWAGDSYYGFTFEAGKKLAGKHGYKVIFQTGNMNMFMVRADLIEGLSIPPVTYKQNDFFKLSDRTDWVTI
jgi:hypothetical protein